MPLKRIAQLLFLLVFTPVTLFAQDAARSFDIKSFQQKTYQKTTSQAAQNSSSPQPSDLRESAVNKEWKIWTQASVIPVTEGSKSFHRFQIQNKAQSLNSEKNFNKNNPLVMFHPDSKNTGLLTGTFKISLVNIPSLNSILKDHQLELLHAFPDINTYFVTSTQESFNLEGLHNALQADQRLNSVHTEILSRVYERK